MDTLFFWVSKVLWPLASPDSLLLLLVLLAWILLVLGATRRAKWVLGVAALAMLSIALVAVGDWVLLPLETRFATNPTLPPRVDGIIVLGGAEIAERSAVWDQVEVDESAERFLASIALARRYPSARLLFTSGSARLANQGFKGADVARRLYLEQGLEESRLLFERNARNTAENATLSKALARPARGEVWILVTSAWHMPRAVGVFCKAGWPVLPYPVDHATDSAPRLRLGYNLADNLGSLSLGIKEWLGLTAYYLTGKTRTLFPHGC